MSAVDHSTCNFAFKTVTCDRCDKTYQCTPWSDFYCTDDDHCCEPCLIGGRQIAVIDLDAPLPEPIFRDPT